MVRATLSMAWASVGGSSTTWRTSSEASEAKPEKADAWVRPSSSRGPPRLAKAWAASWQRVRRRDRRSTPRGKCTGQTLIPATTKPTRNTNLMSVEHCCGVRPRTTTGTTAVV
ncbi:unnamed protein product, partial [Ixodes pacificus]